MDKQKPIGVLNSGMVLLVFSPKSKRPLWPFVIIILISIAIYSTALFNGFVWDDDYQILRNNWIKGSGQIPEIFKKNVWGFKHEAGNYYRPLMHLAFKAEYFLFGPNPAGYHLVNVLLHSGVSIMVYLLAKRLWAGYGSSIKYTSIPFISAVLFSVNPVHTEAVTWVSGFPEVSFTFFYLLSLFFYIKAVEESSRVALALSASSFFISALCKETALTLPLALLCYDLLYRKQKGRAGEYIKRYSLFFLTIAFYIAARIYALKGFAPERHHAGLSSYDCFINVFPLLFKYLYLLLFPINLNVFSVFHSKPLFSIVEIVSLAAIALFAGGAYLASKKEKNIFFSLSIIAIPLLPVLYIPGIGEPIFAERYLYLPSLGFSMITAFVISRQEIGARSFLRAGTAIVLIAGIYSIGTIERNRVWHDNLSLWSDAVSKSPDGPIPHNNLGSAYSANGMMKQAEKEFSEAIKLDNNFTKARINLSNLYFSKGLLDRAEDELEISLKSNTDRVEVYNNLAVIYFSRNQVDKAAQALRTALEFNPDVAEVHYNLGVAYLQKGLIDMAAEEYRAALEISPSDPDAHCDLARIYSIKGMDDMAMQEYKAAIKYAPKSMELHNNLANIYLKNNFFVDAIKEYSIALELNPDTAEAHSNLGNAFLNAGLPDKAIKEQQAAIKIKPNFAEAHYNLGLAFMNKNLIDDAIKEYVAAIKANPKFAEAHYNLGMAYVKKGLLKNGLEEYKTATQLRPDLVFAPGHEIFTKVHG